MQLESRLLSTATVILVHTQYLSDNRILSSYNSALYNSIPAGELYLEPSCKRTGEGEYYHLIVRLILLLSTCNAHSLHLIRSVVAAFAYLNALRDCLLNIVFFTRFRMYGMATRHYYTATLRNTLNSLLVHVKLFYS